MSAIDGTDTKAEWTAGAVSDHCHKAGEQGYMNASTAGAMATAVKKVVAAVHGSDWESVDLRDVDVEELFHRFRQKASFKVETAQAYEGRMRRAIESYRLRLDDPNAWVAEMRDRTRGTRGRSKSSGPTPGNDASQPAVPTAGAGGAVAPAPPALGETEGLVQYVFPVRPGVFARLHLPADLRKTEVRRLAAFLDTLTLEPVPELGTGEDDDG